MADPLATAVGQLEPCLLAGDEDRRAAIGLRLLVGSEKLDRAALPLLHGPELRLKTLHMQALEVRLFLEVLSESVEHVARTRCEGLPLAPVRAEVIKVLWPHPALLGGQLQVQAVARDAFVQLAQARAEDHLILGSRGVDVS